MFRFNEYIDLVLSNARRNRVTKDQENVSQFQGWDCNKNSKRQQVNSN